MEHTNERTVRYLQDAHAAEVGIEKMLEKFADQAEAPEVAQLMREHLLVTRRQAERLEARIRSFGEEPSGSKGFFNSIMAKVSELMNAAHDEEDQRTQDLVKAYATEHLEIGMYESLAAYCESIGDSETAQLARELQAEEEQAADLVFPHISLAAESTAGEAAIDTTSQRASNF